MSLHTEDEDTRLRTIDRVIVTGVWFAFLAGLCWTCAPELTEAQAERQAVVLARACVGEVGFAAPDEVCAAITYVHIKRAERQDMSPARMARLYSQALRRPIPSRHWVNELRDSAEEPKHWPAASWERHRARFAELVQLTQGALDGDVVDPCPASMHYGSRRLDGVPTGHELDDACSANGRQVFYRRSR